MKFGNYITQKRHRSIRCLFFLISYFYNMFPKFDLSKFENKRILIVGDIMLDEFIHTTSNRNSPEYKDVPILKIKEKKQYLGGAANVALNIKKLKAIPYLIGIVGEDVAAQTIYELLHQAKITNQYIYGSTRQKTTVKSRVFLNKKPIFRIDAEEKIIHEELVNHFILKQISDAIKNQKPHVIILQDYNKGVLNAATISDIIALAKQHNISICVDPKHENWDLFKDVDLFKPNEKELLKISEKLLVNENNIENIAQELQKKINFKYLLVTLGSKGNFTFDGQKSEILHQKSEIQNADVCGAGDTVIAVASLGLACGFSLNEIAEISNKAGFIVCQKENIQPITFDELERK